LIGIAGPKLRTVNPLLLLGREQGNNPLNFDFVLVLDSVDETVGLRKQEFGVNREHAKILAHP